MNKNILNIYYRETLDVVDSYEEYLSSMHITLDTQLWKKSLLFNTQKAYQKYLNEYPKGNYRDEAQLKINAISKREAEAKAWKKALSKNTKSSYETYLMSYYNGLHKNEAKKKVDEFIRVEKEKELEEQRLRNIELAKERIRLEKIEQEKKLALDKEKEAWKKTKDKDTKEAYIEYLENYLDGKFSNEAKKKIDEFTRIEQHNKEDKKAWQKTKDKDTKEAYIEYLENFKNGEFRFNAEKRKLKLDSLENNSFIIALVLFISLSIYILGILDTLLCFIAIGLSLWSGIFILTTIIKEEEISIIISLISALIICIYIIGMINVFILFTSGVFIGFSSWKLYDIRKKYSKSRK